MKNLGILMALFIVYCGLSISSVSAESVHLPQLGSNSIDYNNISKIGEEQVASIGWQYTDDKDYTDLLPYMLNLSKVIDNKWSYKVDEKVQHFVAVVNITIYKNGSFSVPKIIKPSSIPDYNQKVIDTLNSFTYLPPLPYSYDGNELSVNLIFAPDQPTKEEKQEFEEQGLVQYLNATLNKIRRNCKTSLYGYTNNRYRVAIVFAIKKDGSLCEDSVRIFQSSGNQKIDQALIKEIEKNSYSPLPAKYTKDLFNMIFVFDAKKLY